MSRRSEFHHEPSKGQEHSWEPEMDSCAGPVRVAAQVTATNLRADQRPEAKRKSHACPNSRAPNQRQTRWVVMATGNRSKGRAGAAVRVRKDRAKLDR